MDNFREMLLWCAVMNYAVLMFWFLALIAAGDLVYRVHTRWFNITRQQFDAVHYGALAAYKVAVFIFNLAPYIALRFLV